MKMEINPEIELNIHNKINDENLISDNFALNFYTARRRYCILVYK